MPIILLLVLTLAIIAMAQVTEVLMNRRGTPRAPRHWKRGRPRPWPPDT